MRRTLEGQPALCLSAAGTNGGLLLRVSGSKIPARKQEARHPTTGGRHTTNLWQRVKGYHHREQKKLGSLRCTAQTVDGDGEEVRRP